VTLDLLFVSGNLSFALAALGFLARDMLWLRLLSIGSGLFGLVYNSLVPAGPLWLVLGWLALFLAINLVQVFTLLRERRPVMLADEEAELHHSVFPHLSLVEFRKLMREARWITLEPGTTVAEQGQPAQAVQVIVQGAVRASRGAHRVADLRDGDMIGELAFASGRPFSATLVTQARTRLVSWPIAGLRSLFARNPLLALAFQNAFIDGAHRLLEQGVKA
jgi:xanthosine utilization system XapX-like protein